MHAERMPRASVPHVSGAGWTRQNFGPILASGLLAGVVTLLFPGGAPWSVLDFFSGPVMGRAVEGDSGALKITRMLVHLCLSTLYAGVITSIVRQLRGWTAMLVGGLLGLALYCANFSFVMLFKPHLLGHEFNVVLTHLFFGLITAAFFKGLTSRDRSGDWPPSHGKKP
jgi:hypothetical protein